ncbi:hypothetical protein [Sinorhizobium medicae]|nr:hypothetical protein [Sinorhizobium medicae]MDX0531558.1 hypothetical protein [Sinorhizobium medicae]MDX0931267.1 hypothetical protein [Sinorhizobium medicae]MDX1060201.1 hypothetical protein [Sinorhizobium medicae]
MRAEAVKATETAQAALVAAREEAGRQRAETARTVSSRAERLSGLGGLLRGRRDGLRKSKIAARVRAAVDSEMVALRIQAAAERAAAADTARQEAEMRARNLRENLMDTGRQLAEVREELAMLRPGGARPGFVLARP